MNRIKRGMAVLGLLACTTSFTISLQAVEVSPPPPPVAPLGVMEDVGKTESLAIGGTIMLCVSYDGKQLLSYDQNSLGPNPWAVHPLQIDSGTGPAVDMTKFNIDSVSCGSDDTIVILDTTGKAYKKDSITQKFSPLAVSAANAGKSLVSVNVGNVGQIWGVSSKAEILQYVNNDWVVRLAEKGLDVAVGADGYVVMINQLGEAFAWDYTDSSWKPLPDAPLDFIKIAVGSKDAIYALLVGGKVAQLVNNAWKLLKSFAGADSAGFQDISINGLGSFGLLDQSDDVWMPTSFQPVRIVFKPATGPVISVAAPVVKVEAAPVVAAAPAVASAVVPADSQAPALQIDSITSTPLFTSTQLQAAIAALQSASPASYTISDAAGLLTSTATATATLPGAVGAAPKAKPIVRSKRAEAIKAGKVNVKANKTKVVIPPKKAKPPRNKQVKAAVRKSQAAAGKKKRPLSERSIKKGAQPVKSASAKPAPAVVAKPAAAKPAAAHPVKAA